MTAISILFCVYIVLSLINIIYLIHKAGNYQETLDEKMREIERLKHTISNERDNTEIGYRSYINVQVKLLADTNLISETMFDVWSQNMQQRLAYFDDKALERDHGEGSEVIARILDVREQLSELSDMLKHRVRPFQVNDINEFAKKIRFIEKHVQAFSRVLR